MNEQNPALYNGNDASEFQPPTQDPQGNVGGGLQPVSGGLQPVSGESSGSQALPKTQSLKVESNGNKLSQGVSTQQSNPTNDLNSFPFTFSVGIGLLLIITVIVIWLASPANENKIEDNKLEPEPTPPTKPKKKKTKKKKSKSKSKKK